MVACFNNLKDKESIERKMDKKTFSAFSLHLNKYQTGRVNIPEESLPQIARDKLY